MHQRVSNLTSLVVLLLSVCATSCTMTLAARIYDLDSAAVLQATFKYSGSGKGPIFVDTPEGQTCEGEYVTVAGGTTGWGTIFAAGYAPTGSATAVANTIAVEAENKQKGSAVATCSDGMVVECEYVTSAWSAQGYGGCRDNRGRRYKLMF